jgi:methionyl-tRNA synthetase
MHGTPVQYCGKDNLRQQSAMWQSMLMAADLPQSHHIVINGFINAAGGQKMSKSLGNTINPYDIIEEYKSLTPYPEDVLRYYLIRHVSPFEDSDMTHEKLAECYTSHLANGLGNLVSRIMNMVVTYDVIYDVNELAFQKPFPESHDNAFEVALDKAQKFELNHYAEAIWFRIGELDTAVATKQPFKKIKENPDEAKSDLVAMVYELGKIAKELMPLLPRTAEAIQTLLKEKKKPEAPLFLRK